MKKIKLMAALAISAAMFMGMGANAQSSFAASRLAAHASFNGSGPVARAVAAELAARPCRARKCVYRVVVWRITRHHRWHHRHHRWHHRHHHHHHHWHHRHHHHWH